MSQRNNPEILTKLTLLRDEMLSRGGDIVSLQQAFDRLYLGYRTGAYDEGSVESGIAEIRAKMGETGAARGLMPSHRSRRDEVLSRNYRELAERLLDQSRGAWDTRHVEIVQGAIGHLAQSDAAGARETARALQSRMSESVWAGGIELSETVSQLETEALEIQQSLMETLAAHSHEREDMPVEGAERAFVSDERETVRKAVEAAQLKAVRARMASEADALKQARGYVNALAQKVSREREQSQAHQDAELAVRAAESLKEASQRLIAAEYKRLGQVYRQALMGAKSDIEAGEMQELSQGIDAAVGGNMNSMNASDLARHTHRVRQSLSKLAEKSAAGKQALQETERILNRVQVLSEISYETPNMVEDSEDSREQYLEARMMFEQKRMQFERNPQYEMASAEMLKALDFEVETPTFDIRQNHAIESALEEIKRVRQIAQSSKSGDVGLYAPTAGGEQARNVSKALKIADSTAPNAAQMPTLQSSLAQRANKVLKDVRQLAYMPSVRSEMGFVGAKERMEPSAQPLFKRVRFSQSNPEVNELLPSLYRISGIKTDDKKGSSPLRKAYDDLDLRGANLELVKIMENQFDTRVRGRRDRVSDAGLDATQRQQDVTSNPHNESLGVISDWIESRHDVRRYAADTKSMIKSGHKHGGDIEATLKGEARGLPREVQEKLSPFLGFDLSNVKIFAGPVSAMASEAMGAHAFTLGHNVFLGENKLNFSSAEGLGLLAHELLHTSHFSSGASVESKEQEAEAMEARVKNAFGSGGSPTLALEKDTGEKSTGKIDTRSKKDGPIAGTVGARYHFDPEFVFDFVCDSCMERLLEEIRLEKERNGDDR